MLDRRIKGPTRWVQIGIVLLALLLRLIGFPHRDETRNEDEIGYIWGSLAMVEGLPAGYKAAPAAPNLWVGWVYTCTVAAVHTLHPGPEESAVPTPVRPFVAVNHALFDQYRDASQLHILWIVSQLALTLWATAAAFRLGWVRGGLAGGILVGGLLAVLPMYVDFTMMSRPYMTAWAFGVLSLDAAVSRPVDRRLLPATIFLGLAIASRIEMLLFAPVVLWEFWHRLETGRLIKVGLRFVFFTAITALLAAPWLLTHLIGNLRTIATVRLGPNPHGATTLGGVLRQLAFSEGLGGAMLALVLVCVALVLPGSPLTTADESNRKGTRWRILLLVLYVAILLESLGHGTVFLHQQGPVVLALITLGAFAAVAINARALKLAPWIAIAVLLIPLIETCGRLSDDRKSYAPNPSAAWIETHVPAGTTIYWPPGLQNPLPTPAAANAAWDEVSDENAWRRKFQAGLERFGVATDQIPRALSEENLVQERGNRRWIFILGSRAALPDSRFDIRLTDSPVFGVKNLPQVFAHADCVVVIHGEQGMPELGMPVVQWLSPSGGGTFIYCSREVAKHLK